MLRIASITASQGFYNILYAARKTPGVSLLVAGFSDQELSDIEHYMDYIDMVLNSTSSIDKGLADKIQRALALLDAIPLQELIDWLTVLRQAIEQGTFAETYENMLSQGLQQLEDIFMILTEDGALAQASIKEMAKNWPSYQLYQLPSGIRASIEELMASVVVRLTILTIPQQISYYAGGFIISQLISIVTSSICGSAAPQCEQAIIQLLEGLGLQSKSPHEIINMFKDKWDEIISRSQWGLRWD
jgi:flavin-binding protein dodecin